MISVTETSAGKGNAPIMKEWLGRAFNAAAFDVGKTNLWLRKLNWPRVTEAQLRKVLMGRDDYHE